MPTHNPLNPNWAARCRESFDGQGVMGTFGVEVAELDAGRVVLEMPFRDDLTQQHGFLHAGIVTTVLDSACGYAAFTLMPETAEVLTVEFKSNFLRPAAGKTFRFVGEVLKPGKTLMVCEGKAYADDKMISAMSATMMVVKGRKGINRS
ncbi:uncharacterized domain 1-containing protein [Cognatiyoonia sediminum]|uniref:Medium/long-chain acyl-CoA thioesterase YigI n=1 Tax=Cognatiyoonia sediminum TaxID=1508389 RepID=A0A1M5NEC6_9RHOB|nr:PaaI family thioesterase [Cognatiyoonia sediminum]SHG87966.1 uncharacterized domain 1-containing protein [Cognatiyoonia sediminum]